MILLATLGGWVGWVQAQYRNPGRAEQNPTEEGEGMLIGPFVFSPSVQTAATYNTNVFWVNDGYDPDGPGGNAPIEPEGDLLWGVRARLAMKLPFSHSYVSVVYLPQYRDYARLTPPRNMSHQAIFDAKLNFSNGSTVRLQDDYSNGYFEARRLNAAETLELSATPFHRNQVDLSYDWSFAGEYGVAGKIERINYNYERTETVDFQDTASGTGSTSDTRLFDFFDYDTFLAEVQAYKSFSRYQVFLAGLASRTDQDRTKFNESQLDACRSQPHDPGFPLDCSDFEDLANTERIDAISAGVGIKGTISSLTNANIRADYTTWDFATDPSLGYSGIALTANVQHNFNTRTSMWLDMNRGPLQATGQYTGYYIRNYISMNFAHSFTPRFGGRIAISWEKTWFPEQKQPVPADPFSLQDYNALFEVRYRPRKGSRPGPFLLTLGYIPQLTTSDRIDYPDVSSQRALITLQYGWF